MSAAAPGADPAGRAHGGLFPARLARELCEALALWDTRDPAVPQPAVRRAVNVAVDAIDQMGRELWQLRTILVGQVLVYDDRVGERTDALLAELKAAREARS